MVEGKDGTLSGFNNRTALVAGAGPAGLVAAIALAQRGWSVRVYERSPELRMFGAGIWLWENGIRSLEEIGVFSGVLERGAQKIFAWEARDMRNRVLHRRLAMPGDRLYVPPRSHLYDSLIERAEKDKVEVVTGTTVVGATPEGEMVLEDGQRYDADLVVGADGVNSKVRASLPLNVSYRELDVCVTRTLIPRLPEERGDRAVENWGPGGRSILYNPAGPEHVYVAFVCSAHDERASKVPLDKEAWISTFPHLESAISRVGDSARWDILTNVVCRPWHVGRAVIVGDAAHALPPTLGQGANLSFSNTLALAEFVTGVSDLTSALRAWEDTMRPVTDHTQKWSNRYNAVSHLWPDSMDGMKAHTVRLFARLPFVEKKLNRAARTLPPGTRLSAM